MPIENLREKPTIKIKRIPIPRIKERLPRTRRSMSNAYPYKARPNIMLTMPIRTPGRNNKPIYSTNFLRC